MSRASKYLRKKLSEGGLLDPEALKKLAAANPPKPGTGVAGPEEKQNAAVPQPQDAATPAEAQQATSQPQKSVAAFVEAQQATPQLQKSAAAQSSAPSISDYDNADDYYGAFAQHYIDTTGDYALENLPTDVKQKWEDAQGDSPEDDTPPAQTEDDAAPYSWTVADGEPDPSRYNGGAASTNYKEDLGAWNQSQRDPKNNNPEFNNGDPKPTIEDFNGNIGLYKEALVAWNAAQGSEDPADILYPDPDDEREDTTTPTIPTTPEAYNNGDPRPIADDYPSYEAFRAALSAWEAAQGQQGPNYGGPGYDEEEDTTTSTTSTTPVANDEGVLVYDSAGGASASSEKRIIEEPVKPKTNKYKKPSTPRDCSSKQGVSREVCIVARQNEKTAMREWQAVEDSWSQYDSDLEQFQNFDPNDNTDSNTDNTDSNTDNTDSNTDNTGNTDNDNNNNNTGGNVTKDDQSEGSVGDSDFTRIEKSDSGAPTVIDQDKPDVTPPTVGVEEVSTIGTTTNARDVRRLDDAEKIERTEDDKVSPTKIAPAQMGNKPKAPKASDFSGPGGGRALEMANEKYEDDLARWKKGIEVEAPIDSTAASMTASTIGQELPTKPMSDDFGDGEEGRRKFFAAREAYNVQIEELRGKERPRFKDFNGDGEAYNQALRDFQEAPLPVTKEVKAAQGEVSEKAEAAVDDAELTQKAEAAERDTVAEEAAMAEDEIVFDVNKDSYINKVTGKVATVEETREAEAKEREAIVGEPATGEAAEIMSMYDYNQSQKRAIQGADAKKAAVKKLKAAGLSDETIAQRLADEPNLIADEMEDLPEDVRTTLSGLPKEALIDVQMESLMSGMEDGEVPAWARPALAKVEANLAKRGMTASSVGRDALFNAIIQSAIPMAQANASAIQGATAQDKQIAADFLAKNAGFQQQMNLANLSNDQQMRLANLSAQNQAASENLSNAQQTELANLNTRMQTNLLQGKIAAEMGVAQLNVDQQTAVVNAQTSAGFDMAKFNAEQQVALTNSKFMQTMVATKFNADQQAAMQNATAMASMDMANLDKNTKLAVTNAQAFLQMDMANLSNEQQATILTAQQQQQALLSNQSAENAAAQFNAANQQQADQFMQSLNTQINQYNATANSARDQFNTTEKNRIAALNAGNELQAQQFEAQLDTDIAKFNEQQDFQRDQWNAANAQAVEQSNVQWRRQANMADTAAQNAANQQNAQISYNLTSQELTQVWQQMRDEAAYIRQSFENEEQRKAQLLATAIGNEKLAEKYDKGSNQAVWLGQISNAIN